MGTKPTYEELKQRVKQLEREALEWNLAKEALQNSLEQSQRYHGAAEEKLQEANIQLQATNAHLEKSIERANTMAVQAEVASIELNQIFNTAADGMRVIDHDFNVIRINETFTVLSGITQAEAIGKKCYEVMSSPMCHTPQCSLTRILDGETRIECEVEKVRSDGAKIPSILTAMPFRGLDGELVGIVENCRDVTERKRAESELLKMEKLQAVMEMAGAVCHELNQPMQAVSGYAELIAAGTSENNPQNEDIKKIKAQIDRMGTITKKLMRITRYETKAYLEGSKIIDIDKASGQGR
jgi:PAS domain S-box-containing protein